MIFQVVLTFCELLLDIVVIIRLTDDEKDVEILLLRQQLRVVERKQQRGPWIARSQKVPLVALAQRLKEKTTNGRRRLKESLLLFKPDTLKGWHRELVRRKWTFKQGREPGRPPIAADLEYWIVKVARENPGLGNEKLEGDLRKLGFEVSATTIRTALIKHGIPPLSERSYEDRSWRTFLNHYREQILACDLFTVETLTLKTLHVLFFIEHATRRVYLAGCTAHPNTAWVTQQARQMVWQLEDRDKPIRFLIHDNDKKLPQSFDTVFKSTGIKIIHIPVRAPNANAFAERWVQTVREECLDRLVILNERHLHRTLKEYVEYYSTRRPHQGLQQDSPLGLVPSPSEGPTHYREVLGGILRDYYREAA